MHRKHYLLVLLFCILYQTGFSQITFGVKSGINIAKIENTWMKTFPITRFSAGVWIRKNLHDKLYLQVDGFYSQKGNRIDDGRVGIIDGRTEINKSIYLDAVPSLGFKLHPNIALEAGGYASYLLKMRLVGSIPNVGERWDKDGKEEYANSDFGLQTGMTLGLSKLSLNVRYYYGIKAIHLQYDASEDRNRLLQITLAYTF